jgi:hypothetical protein
MNTEEILLPDSQVLTILLTAPLVARTNRVVLTAAITSRATILASFTIVSGTRARAQEVVARTGVGTLE